MSQIISLASDVATASLRNDVYAVIVDRLVNRNGCFIPKSPNDIDCLLPSASSSPAQLPLWSRICNTSTLVSDSELESAFNLSKSTAESEQPLQGSHNIYIRSFCIHDSELDEIITKVQERGLISAALKEQRVREWRATVPPGHGRIWVRYAGQTQKTPWTRHKGDLAGPANTFATSFLRVLQDHFPHITKSANIFTFEAATTTDQGAADQREQAAIALFWSGLLNVQWGGVGNVSHDYINRFSPFSTNLIRTLAYDGPVFNSSSALRYVQSLQDYYEQHIESKVSFTDALRDIYVRQARAKPLTSGPNCSLTLIMGSDSTADNFRNPEPFLSGHGKSSTLMSHFFSSMAAAEAEMNAIEVDNTIFSRFQFANLFPWPKKDVKDLLPLTRLHRSYIKDAKPLIVLPLSDRVAAVVWNGLDDDFVASYKFQGGAKVFDGAQFSSVVGQPKVCQLGNTDQYFVCIPAYHPRKMAKLASAGQRLYGRVMFQILSVFWLTASTIMDLSQHTEPATSYTFCSQVVASVKSKIESTDFSASFINDRRLLSDFFAQQLKGQTDGFVARARDDQVRQSSTLDTEARVHKSLAPALPLPESFYNGGQGWIAISNRPDKVKGSLQGRQVNDANSADPLWFFSKFFEEFYECDGYPESTVLVDLGHPALVETSMWLLLQEFCEKSRYTRHPFLKEIRDFCTFENAARNGGKQTASSIVMALVIKALFPRSAGFKEWFYKVEATKDNRSLKSMILIPAEGSDFTGFANDDLDSKKVWKAEKRKQFGGIAQPRKRAKKGTGIYDSAHKGSRNALGLQI